jgi:pimeloyl-ACP methyl ester carboxylesterase
MASTLTIPTLDGRALDVWLAGPADGEPLLFHHGTPGSARPFDHHVAEMAARGLRLVGISRPGYGASTRKEGRVVADVADDTRAVLDHLGIDRSWILGWSGGGPHALACAALLPDRVRGSALIAGVAPYPADGLDWLAGMGAENIEEFGAALAGPEQLRSFIEPFAQVFREARPEDVAGAFGDLIDEVDRDSLTDGLARYLAEGNRDALRDSFWGWFDDDMAFTRPWGFDVASIPGRVHVWQGGHDRMVPFAHGRWLAANVGGACPHLSADGGHLSLVVERFGAILDELVAGAA